MGGRYDGNLAALDSYMGWYESFDRPAARCSKCGEEWNDPDGWQKDCDENYFHLECGGEVYEIEEDDE